MRIARAAILGLVLLLIGQTEWAQVVRGKVVVQISKSINVGSSVLPPGLYLLQVLSDLGNGRALIEISGANAKDVRVTVTVFPIPSGQISRETSLSLINIGGAYYPEQVLLRGESYGFQFPAERPMTIRNGTVTRFPIQATYQRETLVRPVPAPAESRVRPMPVPGAAPPPMIFTKPPIASVQTFPPPSNPATFPTLSVRTQPPAPTAAPPPVISAKPPIAGDQAFPPLTQSAPAPALPAKSPMNAVKPTPTVSRPDSVSRHKDSAQTSAAPPSASRDSSADTNSVLEQELRKLQVGNFVDDVPDQMREGEWGTVRVRIAKGAVSVETLTEGLSAKAKKTIEQLKVSTRMKVTLTGPEFDISDTTPGQEEQWVDDQSPTTWEWQVRPKTSGTATLHISALVELEGMAKGFKEIDRQVRVKIDPAAKLSGFVTGNWQWILGSIGGSGVLGFLFRKLSKSKAAA